jgi:thiol-disulfide isomerase/thioredoxin
MRIMLVALAFAGLATLSVAKDDGKKLSVGDAAPPVKADKWLQGKEVKGFEKDHVYVVEFWATWCGPCIVMMPHMSDLQQQYKKEVTFIGFSSKDQSNNEEKVTAFVKKRGPKLKYTFAYGEDRNTYNAWMQASGQGGIPCSFVVDKEGKIAFKIQLPMPVPFRRRFKRNHAFALIAPLELNRKGRKVITGARALPARPGVCTF